MGGAGGVGTGAALKMNAAVGSAPDKKPAHRQGAGQDGGGVGGPLLQSTECGQHTGGGNDEGGKQFHGQKYRPGVDHERK